MVAQRTMLTNEYEWFTSGGGCTQVAIEKNGWMESKHSFLNLHNRAIFGPIWKHSSRAHTQMETNVVLISREDLAVQF